MRTESGRDEARGARPAKAEVGALVDRLRDLRGRRTGARTRDADADGGAERRIALLELRIEHLEAALEGLQDAVDRQAVLQDERVAELRRRTEPAEIARALSEDARRRGV
jgi:uncharacterized coiled-coil protein SlyX